MMLHRTPVRSALSLLMAFSLQAEAQTAPALLDPRDAAGAMTQAVAAQDADAVAALYLPEAILLGPGLTPVAGQAAIRDVWARNYAAGFATLTFDDIRLSRGQNSAAIVWTWTGRIAPQGQPVQVLRGRSLVYFTLTPDGWRISADMWQAAP